MPRRVLFALVLATALILAIPVSASIVEEPRFQLGFATLAGLIPDVVGVPVENERHNPINGDGLQQTTNGLMVWRKADNWTAFTNGYWTWINGPYGVQNRSNAVRFEWEAELGRTIEVVSSPEPALSPVVVPPGSSQSATVEPSPPADGQVTPIANLEPTATSAAVFVSMTPTPTLVPTVVPSPTSTPVPTIAPSPTRQPTATPQPTATRAPTPIPTIAPSPTAAVAGTRSAEPAGNWVTSTSSATRYYCSADSPYWKTWSASNRIWFATEADLLRAYPGRTRHE